MNNISNDAYMQLLAEQAPDRSSGMQILEMIRQQYQRNKVKEQAIRAQHIQPNEITG